MTLFDSCVQNATKKWKLFLPRMKKKCLISAFLFQNSNEQLYYEQQQPQSSGELAYANDGIEYANYVEQSTDDGTQNVYYNQDNFNYYSTNEPGENYYAEDAPLTDRDYQLPVDQEQQQQQQEPLLSAESPFDNAIGQPSVAPVDESPLTVQSSDNSSINVSREIQAKRRQSQQMQSSNTASRGASGSGNSNNNSKSSDGSSGNAKANIAKGQKSKAKPTKKKIPNYLNSDTDTESQSIGGNAMRAQSHDSDFDFSSNS